MKLSYKNAVAAIATLGCVVLGTARADAATFTFSLLMGTSFDSTTPQYNPLKHGSMGQSLFSGTFAGQDLDGNGSLYYNKALGQTRELTSFQASWGGFEFGLEDIESFIAGTFPGERKNYYGEDILMRWIRMARGDIHLDYKPLGRFADLYQQFRVYQCPATIDCHKIWTIDYAMFDGRLPPGNLLGFQNIANLGLPAYKAQLAVAPPPQQSVPEPSAVAGLTLLTLTASRMRRKKASV